MATDATAGDEDWDDLLGSGAVLKQIIERGRREDDDDIDMEAPRKFFALIDIETKCNGKLVESESHKNYLINSDVDLFPGVHLVIPLMDIHERSRYIFDSKFAYGELSMGPLVPARSKLECIITLKFRCPFDEFLDQLTLAARLGLARRKNERGKFWFKHEHYSNAIAMYQSMVELCQLDAVVDDQDP